MNVAISTFVTPVVKRGVGNYVVHLIRALQEVDKENRYHIFVGQDTKHLFEIWASNFRVVTLPIGHDPRWLMRPVYYFWQNSLISVYLKQNQIDLLHLPNLLPLLIRFVPTVVTIPDMAEYKVTKYSRFRQLYRRSISHLVVRNADRIITISHSAKQDISTVTGAPLAKIDVTYLASAIPGATTIDSSKPDVLTKYHLKREYILYVGSALPHKNLKRVLEAFMLLKSRYKIPHQLVLVGNRDTNAALLMEEAEQMKVDGHIVLAGYVPDDDLPALYQNAGLFVFPSLHEGFGLPILEAMTCGTPVVTSNVSSLPEVAGDAAILVDPMDVKAIADGMWAILRDKDRRQAMVAKGRMQAAKFSWEVCARQTLESYRKALDP